MTTTHLPTITVWHNCVGRPVPFQFGDGAYEGRSGISGGDPVKHWLDSMDRYGHAITTVGYRDANHHIIGVGVGHDDADWAESRFQEGSQAAYLENEYDRGPTRSDDRHPHLAAILRERAA
jgi:hypothetical protein